MEEVFRTIHSLIEEIKERINEIQSELQQDAQQISERYDGAPVVIIVAGPKGANVPKCITVHTPLGAGQESRMRDLLGILQAAIQIESVDHLLGNRLDAIVSRLDAQQQEIDRLRQTIEGGND